MTRQYFEAKAREKYPITWQAEARAAYVEACMEMLPKIGDAWDAGEARLYYEKIVDEGMADYYYEGRPIPPTKQEYISKLFK